MTCPRQLGDARTTAMTSVNAGGTAATAILSHTAAAWAVPVVGAAVAGVGLALTLIFARKGPWQRVEATKLVEAVIAELQANLKAYFEGPRTISSQAAALANYDAAWAWLASPEGLANPKLGNPGKVGLAERSPGGKWDMRRDLRDPIANDPEVRPDPTVAENIAASAAGFFGGNWTMVAGVALILIGLLLTGDKNGHV